MPKDGHVRACPGVVTLALHDRCLTSTDTPLSQPSKIAAHFGLAPPYRFERTIIAVFALLVVLMLTAGAVWLCAIDELPAHSPRLLYFGYIATALLLVFATLPWPRLAAALLVVAAVDTVWGLGSFAFDHNHGQASLLPAKLYEPPRFRWQALLQAEPIPSITITSSTGLAVSHTSQGTRGQEPAASEIANHAIVATVGGSSTYDIGTADGETWSDRLNDALGRDRYLVVNHGVPGYTSVENLLQTTFYLEKFGHPRCALYYVGFNDLRNAFIPNLDPAYADFHLPSQVDSLRVRRAGGSNVTVSPLLTEIARLADSEIDTVRYAVDPYGRPSRSGDDPELLTLYERNLRTISAINRSRGIATVWIDQLANVAALKGDGQYGWMPLVRDRDIWPMLQRLNAVMAEVARSQGDAHVAPPVDRFGPADFVDNVHFSARGAAKFAAFVAPVAREACR